jgi:hypothetical protein
MNCKPDQMAWIVVPREYRGTGVDKLDRSIVKTLVLLPGLREPVWAVTPQQTVLLAIDGLDCRNRPVRRGETLAAEGIPDAWLRPFDPRSAPESLPALRDLEQTA